MEKEMEKIISIGTIKEYLEKNNKAGKISSHNADVMQDVRLNNIARHLHGKLDLTINEEDVNINTKNGKTALHLAVQKDDLYAVKFLVKERANINTKDKDGWTPLHYATDLSYLDIVVYLIDNGADLNITDNESNTTRCCL